jgi:hypothetical protein
MLNNGQKAQIDALVTAIEEAPRQTKAVLTSGTIPTFYIAEGQSGWTICLIDGCTTSGLATALVDGYTPPITGATQYFANRWADISSDYIVGVLQSMSADSDLYVTVAGHSGGGIVAQLVADKLKFSFPANHIRWHTFGSPKCSYLSRARVADKTPGVRWIWHLDPIPLFPLTFTDAPFLLPVVGLRTIISWSQFVHWEGGWQLVPDAVGHPEELPTSASVSPFQSVAAWLFSSETGSGTNHAIADYETFMGNEAAFYEHPASNLPAVAPVEAPPATSSRLLTNAEQQVVANIVNAENVQNAQPVAIPGPQVFLAQRQGRVWFVTFGGVVVSISASRRSARGLARLMNDAFRRLQRAAVVDPVAFNTQLGEYFVAATDPSGGFRPTMNTTF